jgi:hypothetical protein
MNGLDTLKRGANERPARVAWHRDYLKSCFARLGIWNGGRGCRCLQRHFLAERTGRTPAYTIMGTGCNAASIMRDSRRDGTFFSGRSLHTMGLGYLRFMQRGASSPVDRCIATPAFRPSRRGVALFCGRVIRAPQISLRGKLAGDPAQDEANRLPSVSINLLRHAHNMTEIPCPILRTRIRNFAEYVA